MSVVMTLPIDPEIQVWLSKRAAVQGINIEQCAVEALRQMSRRPTIHEVFADVAADFEASGMTDEELGGVIEHALLEVRTKKP